MVSQGHARRWSFGGALLAALAASSCCLGPLLLAVLGVGGAGATATLGAYRPYLLAGTVLLLGAGFFFTYRKPGVSADACGCEKPRASRVGRIGLWIGTLLVILVAAAPPLLAKWSSTGWPSASADDPRLANATIDVQGIDCKACAAPIRKVLAKVGGLRELRVDVAKHAVLVTYEPAPGRLAAYVGAINDLGYEATLPGGKETRR